MKRWSPTALERLGIATRVVTFCYAFGVGAVIDDTVSDEKLLPVWLTVVVVSLGLFGVGVSMLLLERVLDDAATRRHRSSSRDHEETST